MSESPSPAAPSRRPASRGPWVLLIVMTFASFGGPFLIWAVLRGGEAPDWPPDRLVEWVVFAAFVALVLTLMAACLLLGVVNRRELAARRAAAPTRESTGPRIP